MSELLTLFLCPAYVIYCVPFIIYAVIITSIFIRDKKIVRGIAILLLAIAIAILMPIIWLLSIIGILVFCTRSIIVFCTRSLLKK